MRPNILLFLTDDHGAWATGCYGNSEIDSPTLDRLAREGTRFANAFTPSPVCSPARACLLTGRTPSQVGIHDWIEEHYPEFADPDWLADEVTLAEILSEAGYRCGLSGKWHLGRSHKTPRGYHWYFGLPHWQGTHRGEYTYVLNDRFVTLRGNKTRLITDYALSFLDHTPSDSSFFLQVGYIATHSPYAEQEPDLVSQYENASFQDIPFYEPHPWHKNEGFQQGSDFHTEDLRSRYANYYAAVTDIDRNVDRILDKLDKQGRLYDTLIVYTSDHGLALGHHGFWGKGNSTRPLNMYEASLRIPLMWRWPSGVEQTQVVNHCVDHYDTFRTLCDIAGAPPPDTRDYPGRSYRSFLSGEAVPDWIDTRFGEYGDLRMIRTPRYKLVKRYPSGPDDLFDLGSDPAEPVNLSENPEYSNIKATLQADLEAFYSRYDDPIKSGLRVKELRQHNKEAEAWRDGLREARGLQVY